MMKLSTLTSRRNLALAGGACLLLVWWIMGGEPAPVIYNTPPIRHEDGTAEYHLIYSGTDLTRGTEDDVDWALIFPKGLSVSSLDERQTPKEIESNPEYTYNLNLGFVLDLPDLEFSEYIYPNETVGVRTVLVVSLASKPVEYGTGKIEENIGLFSARMDMEANYNCRRAAEVGPGVFQLRPVNEAELAQMIAKYGANPSFGPSRNFMPPTCNRPGYNNVEFTRFAVYDTQNKPIGIGDCTSPITYGETVFEPCTFRFWLPQRRVATFDLERRYIPELHKIYKRVVELVSAATDVEKSRNMEEWSN